MTSVLFCQIRERCSRNRIQLFHPLFSLFDLLISACCPSRCLPLSSYSFTRHPLPVGHDYVRIRLHREFNLSSAYGDSSASLLFSSWTFSHTLGFSRTWIKQSISSDCKKCNAEVIFHQPKLDSRPQNWLLFGWHVTVFLADLKHGVGTGYLGDPFISHDPTPFNCITTFHSRRP